MRLIAFFNTGSALPPELASVFGLTGTSLGNALSELDGEIATSAEHSTFPLTRPWRMTERVIAAQRLAHRWLVQ
jgi:hypothetical protein